jgi:Flp pilus assembly pilin Flp
MNTVLTTVRRLVKKDDGQDLLEYGLLAVLIAVVVMTSISTVGSRIYDVFWKHIANAI